MLRPFYYVAFALALLIGATQLALAREKPSLAAPSVQRFSLQPLETIDRREIPPLDLFEIAAQDAKDATEGFAPRYAVVHEVQLTPQNSGTWERLGQDTSVWRMAIACENALHINFGFSRFVVPEGSVLFIYSADLQNVVRPFTHLDVAPHGELWTPPVPGNTIVIELTIPTRQIANLQLTLGSINAGYRRFGPIEPKPLQPDMLGGGGTDSGACNVDVVCPEGDEWRLQIPSVAVISTGGSRFCSGYLVNNVRQDRKPYFITANHCGVTAGNAASLVVFWNYHNSYCRPPGSAESGQPGNGSLSTFSTGSTFRSANAQSDFTLVELSQSPNPAWRLSWAGWDMSGANSPSGAIIHHPNTEEKRITFYNTPTTDASWPCSSSGGNGTHLRAFYSLGTTEPGSSGSPIFDNNKRVIGQLHGGPASCATPPASSYDCYGRFSQSWTGGGTNTTRLSNWLNPDNVNVQFIDTIGAGLVVSPATGVTHKGPVGGPFSNNPKIYTFANSTGSSANYSVSILPGGNAPLLLNGGSGPLTGTIANNGSVNVTVTLASSANSLPAGVYSTTIKFRDITNGIEYLRTHILEIGQVTFTVVPSEALNGSGPVGGPFTPAGGKSYTITSTSPNIAMVRVQPSANWISIDGEPGGQPVEFPLWGEGFPVEFNVNFSSAATTLGAGLHSGSVAITNVTGGGSGTSSDTSRAVTLEIGSLVYQSSDGPISIPDNNSTGISSVINVTDGVCIGDVNVTINTTHTYVGDLRYVLRHNNVAVMIIDRPGYPGSPFGCSEDNYNNIVLDDEGTGGAIEGICQANLSSPPSYMPNEALTAYDNTSASGQWTLTVSDHAGQDLGSLNSWSLRIVPLPVTCPPVANDVALNVPVLVISNVTLSGSSDNGPLNYIITSLPANGYLFDPNAGAINQTPYVIAGGENVVRYRPASNYAGPDVFHYKVNDGQDSNTANVNLTVGGPQLVHSYPFNTNPGWSFTGPQTNGWAFGQPLGFGGDPASAYTGTSVYGYNLNGAYQHNLSETSLTTSSINCANLSGVIVKFQRWLGIEQSTYDHAKFQISTDGVIWTTIWSNPSGVGQSIIDTAWSQQSYEIPQADGHSTVYLRWTLGPTDSSVAYSGWNIDDVEVWGVRPPCQADCTGDGVVNVADLLAVIQHWGPCAGCSADIAPAGGDNVVNVTDLLKVIQQWGGCP